MGYFIARVFPPACPRDMRDPRFKACEPPQLLQPTGGVRPPGKPRSVHTGGKHCSQSLCASARGFPTRREGGFARLGELPEHKHAQKQPPEVGFGARGALLVAAWKRALISRTDSLALPNGSTLHKTSYLPFLYIMREAGHALRAGGPATERCHLPLPIEKPTAQKITPKDRI